MNVWNALLEKGRCRKKMARVRSTLSVPAIAPRTVLLDSTSTAAVVTPAYIISATLTLSTSEVIL